MQMTKVFHRLCRVAIRPDHAMVTVVTLSVSAHQRHHRLGKIAKDLALRFGWRQQADAGRTVALHLRQLMRNLLGRARDAGPENRLGRNENLLARLHVSAMPVVDLPEAFLLGQAEARDVFEVASPVVPEIRGNQLVLFTQIAPNLVSEMQDRRYVRAGLLDYPLVTELFTGVKNATGDKCSGDKWLRQFAAGLFRAVFDERQLRPYVVSPRRYPAVTVHPGGFARPGTIGRNIDRNRVFEVDEVAIAMEKSDLAGRASEGVIDRLAVEQRADHAQIFAELLEWHRMLPHHAHRGMPRPDPEKDAPRRDLVDRRDRMRGNRRDTSAGNRDAGANLDALGGLRRERQRGVAVGPDHLGVGYPGAVVTQLLCVTDQVPFIDMSVEADSEFHRYVLLMRRARAAGSKTVSTVGLQAGSAIPGFLFYPGWFDVNSRLPEGFHIAGPLRLFRFLITPTALFLL